MASYRLPNISEVSTLPTSDRAALLDALFEPSVQLHTLSLDLLHTTRFASYDDLISAIGVQLTELAESSSTSDTELLEAILGSHPRLGEKKVESAQSRSEQAQLHTGGEGEAETLARLNLDYERAFPGLRYVVFVNGRSRSVIMDDMRARINRANIQLERMEAIKVCHPMYTSKFSELIARPPRPCVRSRLTVRASLPHRKKTHETSVHRVQSNVNLDPPFFPSYSLSNATTPFPHNDPPTVHALHQ